MRHASASLLVLGILLGCSSTEKVLERLPVDVGTYTVMPPSAEGWEIEVDRERQEVAFVNRKLPTCHAPGFTLVRVFPIRPAWIHEPLEPAHVAGDFFAFQEGVLLNKQLQEPRYRLGYVNKETMSIAGKTLHVMSYWELEEPGPFGDDAWANQSVLYLYFPTKFASERILYQFRITEFNRVGVLGVSAHLRLIRPVIESFTLKEALHVEEPPICEPEVTP